MTPDATRLAAAIRGWLDSMVGRDWDDGWTDELAADLIASGVRWARPVEDVELPEVNE